MVIGGGGMFDGRSLAAALSLGAAGVWVGTRFIASAESGAPPRHQKLVLQATVSDTTKTLVYSGRPLRTFVTEYVKDWEARPDEIKRLCDAGKIPIYADAEAAKETDKGLNGKEFNFQTAFPMLMGQCSGAVTENKPAKEIILEMMQQAVQVLRENAARVKLLSNL